MKAKGTLASLFAVGVGVALVGASDILLAAAPVKFLYDPAGRLEMVEFSSGLTVTYTYDANGNRLHESVKHPSTLRLRRSRWSRSRGE